MPSDTRYILGPCLKLWPCAGCCPGISLYAALYMSFTLPRWGISGGPFLLSPITTQYLLGIACGGNLPWDGHSFGCVPPQGWPVDCCNCSCSFQPPLYSGPASDDTCCPALYPTCADQPAIASGYGTTPKFNPFESFLTCRGGGGYVGGCNPPPAGYGAENPAVWPGRTRGTWLAVAAVQDCDTGDGTIHGDPGWDVPQIGRFTGAIDCTSYRCRCPHGFYAKFGGSGNGGVSGYPGFPGQPVADPDGYIEITGTEPGGDCPDQHPCDGLHGESLMAGLMAKRRASGLLVAEPRKHRLLVSNGRSKIVAVPAGVPKSADPGPPAKIELPCVDLGDSLNFAERTARGLGHVRDWRWCNHPEKPQGDVVCRCQGCGPSCRGYVAGEEPDA